MYEKMMAELACLQELINNMPGIQKQSKKDNISNDIFSLIITDYGLKKQTEDLFRNGHYKHAVAEAYIYIDNLVKRKVIRIDTGLTGSNLMQKVFSKDNPLLKINKGKTRSELDEQLGYMQIFAGSMTGIRNPRAHESNWEDSENKAIELLALANHLVEIVKNSEVVTEEPQ